MFEYLYEGTQTLYIARLAKESIDYSKVFEILYTQGSSLAEQIQTVHHLVDMFDLFY